MKQLLFTFILIALITIGYAGEEARLMRFPDINGDLVSFVYAGDIWTVNADGGSARRLTSHKGMELFPKISPDGRWIAFSAEYSGSRQVYVMPSDGGTPRQLTYYNDVGPMPPRGGWDYVVLDWTPDSQKIMVRANRTPWGERSGKYFMVPLDGGLETPLQITEAGFGSFSPDGKKICFAPIYREFRTWKRYKGGRAADIWIYDLEKDASKRLTTFPGSDQIPSWYKDTIYFASDRSLTLNIFAYQLNTGDITQLTHHTDYDVMWPSGEKNLLVYEVGGYLYKLNLDDGKESRLKVVINYDSPDTLPYFKNVKDFVRTIAVSPTGKRAVVDARGDIFTVPAKKGEIENLTRSQGVREISPAWSPDGKYIAYYSDKTGEYEVYIKPADGSGEPLQLTSDSTSWKFQAVWSPDSSKLLFCDKQPMLQILDVKSKKITQVDKGRRGPINDYGWSPDSHWITYSQTEDNLQDAVWVYSLGEGKPRKLTNDRYSDSAPVFSNDGRYIFFFSHRNFNLKRSSFEADYLYSDSQKIYAAALQKSTPPLFAEEDDRETEKKEDPPAKKSKTEKKKSAPAIKEIIIDFDGIDQRIIELDVAAGRYNWIQAVEDGVVYLRDRSLYKFDIKKKKEEMIISGVSDLDISADKKNIVYSFGSEIGIVAIAPNQKAGDGKLDLTDLVMKIEPRKEWAQIFNDGRRIYRDWFYAANLHGVDWNLMKKRYGQLVPYVNHRADLDYIFGEMVGETNTGHSYVQYGDLPEVTRMDTGLLGAQFKADPTKGRYLIEKIFAGENWNPSRRSPLTMQGVNIKEGDYLMSLNGSDVTIKDNPYRFLENTVGKRIEISVSSTGSTSDIRKFTVKPIASELELFYLDWVESRRKLVDELSGGRIGYIHVPDTAVSGNRELFKGFYTFHNKDALIIDERYNGGGFIPAVMVELLGRTTLSYWSRRGTEPNRTPGIVHEGPKAMLINGHSSSGGDAFPYYFRKRNLGTIIGTRTWGGLVGISGNAEFADGGVIMVPTFGMYDTDGQWAVEGLGVSPDIEVTDEPHLTAQGKDPSVETAVKVLLKQLAEKPVKKVKEPAAPDRSKWHEKEIK